ncbi:hypothetical protein PQ689_03095 [Thermoanaerobacterium thermosaccharolyticum]|uniref:hypothetical protein n=1 Tax=Thermoanaerobacterium thermosaccharolyticum TaxID=1517 RepID=UPI003DA86B2F
MKNRNTNSNIVRFPVPESNNSKAVNSDYTIANSSEKVYNLLENDNYGLKVQSELLKAYQEIASTKEDDHMDWQEKYIDKLDQNINEMKQGLRDTENRISEMINKHIEYTTHLDKERHDEILKINDLIESINNKIDSTNKWIIGLIITTIVAIASMALSVWLK